MAEDDDYFRSVLAEIMPKCLIDYVSLLNINVHIYIIFTQNMVITGRRGISIPEPFQVKKRDLTNAKKGLLIKSCN